METERGAYIMMGFLQTGRALYVLAVICFGGIFVRLAAGSFYKKLIKESANMALTKNRYLRNLKQNAEDTYRINMGMNNAAVYLQRQLGNLKFLGFSLSGLENLAVYALFFPIGTAVTILTLSFTEQRESLAGCLRSWLIMV